jgi:hypothetical protein
MDILRRYHAKNQETMLKDCYRIFHCFDFLNFLEQNRQ